MVESVDADEGWRMCGWAGGQRPSQSRRTGREPSRAGWTGDGVGTAEKASRGLAVECGQCQARASEREDVVEQNGARGSGIQTRKHTSLFVVVCLFVQRKIVTGIV